MARQRCYYEVLGVSSTATADEIKSAYRRQALAWHPDKNQGRVEVATAAFNEIQNAYDVLGDPMKRRWYDIHRETILGGRDESHKAGFGRQSEAAPVYESASASTTSPFENDKWAHFCGFVYSGFRHTAYKDVALNVITVTYYLGKVVHLVVSERPPPQRL